MHSPAPGSRASPAYLTPGGSYRGVSPAGPAPTSPARTRRITGSTNRRTVEDEASAPLPQPYASMVAAPKRPATDDGLRSGRHHPDTLNTFPKTPVPSDRRVSTSPRQGGGVLSSRRGSLTPLPGSRQPSLPSSPSPSLRGHGLPAYGKANPPRKLTKSEKLTEKLFGKQIAHAATATPGEITLADAKLAELTKFMAARVNAKDVKEAFRKMDHNKDGQVEYDEFSDFLRKQLGFQITDDSMAIILERTDRDGNGELDIHEFFGSFHLHGLEDRRRIKQERNETVMEKERKEFMKKNKAKLVHIFDKIAYIREQAKPMADTIKLFDQNRDGVVELDEFKEVFRRMHAPLTENEIELLFNYGVLGSEIKVLNFSELQRIVASEMNINEYGPMYLDRWAKNSDIELENYKQYHNIQIDDDNDLHKPKDVKKMQDLNSAYQNILDKLIQKSSDIQRLYVKYANINPLKYHTSKKSETDQGIPKSVFRLGLEGMNIEMPEENWELFFNVVDKSNTGFIHKKELLDLMASQTQFGNYDRLFVDEAGDTLLPHVQKRKNMSKSESVAADSPRRRVSSLEGYDRNVDRLERLSRTNAFQSFLDKLPLCSTHEDEIGSVFRRYDKTGSGRLTYEDFKTAFSYVNADVKPSDFRIIAGKFDENCSGWIKYPEFMKHVQHKFQTDREAKARARRANGGVGEADPETAAGSGRLASQRTFTSDRSLASVGSRGAPLVGLCGPDPSPARFRTPHEEPRVSHHSGKVGMWEDIKFTTSSKEIALFDDVGYGRRITRRSASPPMKNTSVNVVPSHDSNMHASVNERMKTMSLSTDTWYNKDKERLQTMHDRTWTGLNHSLHRDYSSAVKMTVLGANQLDRSRIEVKKLQRATYMSRCAATESQSGAYQGSE